MEIPCINKVISNYLASPCGTIEQTTWLPSPGQGQFNSPVLRAGFECVHGWSQHRLPKLKIRGKITNLVPRAFSLAWGGKRIPKSTL